MTECKSCVGTEWHSGTCPVLFPNKCAHGTNLIFAEKGGCSGCSSNWIAPSNAASQSICSVCAKPWGVWPAHEKCQLRTA